MKSSKSTLLALLVVALVSISYLDDRICYATEQESSEESKLDFTQFSLEELKNVEIVSVSKKPEKISEVPAAVYVITQEDIRRSGATSIQEALRMAPGVHVARKNTTEWAVNIRGLNNEFAKNLLVLIDGRSVYTHVFSGVFWDIQDTIMEDIDRIEIIRGPGAVVWGANAVNGVINIITKNASQTKGWEAVMLGGSEEQNASLRYGGTYEDCDYRIYSKFFNRGKLSGVVDAIESDYINYRSELPSKEWRSGRAGFRMDLAPGKGLPEGSNNTYTLEGEAYQNRYDKELKETTDTTTYTTTDETTLTTSEAGGGHILGRWEHKFSYDSDTVLQFYYNHDEKDYDPASGRVNTTDLDFQHRFSFFNSHDVIWGLEYKYITDEFNNSDSVQLDPEYQDQHFVSTFIQDEFTIKPDKLFLTFGSKFEHNEITGLEIQPSLRLRYTPDPVHSFWAAISRAVRVPSRLELNGTYTDEKLLLDSSGDIEEEIEIQIIGNSHLRSEKLTAYEIGHRWQPINYIWFNSAIFYHDYVDLIGEEPLNPESSNPPYTVYTNQNNKNGRSYGFELASDWQVRHNLMLSLAYTFLNNEIDQTKWFADSGAPRNILSARSLWDITLKLDFDLWLRYVDNVPERDVASYITLDARLGYQLTNKIELSLVGQNLFEKSHEEFSGLEVDRSIYAKIDWQF
jgi:iron complex outermembrane receptor protein